MSKKYYSNAELQAHFVLDDLRLIGNCKGRFAAKKHRNTNRYKILLTLTKHNAAFCFTFAEFMTPAELRNWWTEVNKTPLFYAVRNCECRSFCLAK